MKIIRTLSLLLLIASQHALAVVNFAVPPGVKQPAKAISVMGDTPKSYQVVYTKITKDPNDQEGKPVIVRTVKGVKPQGAGSAPINELLAIPQADIILSAGVLPDMVAKVAGVIDPRAGAVAKGASAVLDESLNIAGQELSKKYKLNAFEIKMLEFLPTEYYYIDNATNSVKVKDKFISDLEQYTRILEGYSDLAQNYNKAVVQYNKLRNAIPAQRPPNVPKFAKERADYDQKYNAAKSFYDNNVRSVLLKKLQIESQLTNYSLHRIALMASQDAPGDGCNTIQWQGPWSLYLYYFIGTKQTNRIKIDFCAKKDVEQNFSVRINGNSQTDDGTFVPGGVNLEAANYSKPENSTIKFPVQINYQDMKWDSLSSAKYSWFDEMITDEHGGDIATYLYPYDLYVLEQKRLKEQADRNDARSKDNAEKFNAAMDELQEAMKSKGQGGLLDKIKGFGSKGPGGEEEPAGGETTSQELAHSESGGESKDYYDTLGITSNASANEIKAAYRKLSLKYHPDKNPDDPNAAEKMKEINEAYSILSNSASRATYDATRKTQGVAGGISKTAAGVQEILKGIRK